MHKYRTVIGFRTMKRHSNKIILISVILTFSLLLSAQYAAAATRKELLEEFCLNNQHSSGAFLDTPTGVGDDDNTLSEFTTYANLFILAQIDSELEKLDDPGLIRSFLRDKYILFSDVGIGDIPQVYYAYFGGLIVGVNYTEELKQDASRELYALQNQTNSGFGSVDNPIPTIAETYYAIKLLKEFGTLNETDTTAIGDFVFSCWDDTSSTFASSQEGNPSLVDAYFAILTLIELDLFDSLNASKKEAVIEYVEDFYFNDTTYANHLGGYGIQSGIIQSSLLYTYYATQILELLDVELHQETLTWVLTRQNPNDFGFIDSSPDLSDAHSSAKLSYYATKIILSFDENAFGDARTSLMNEELWQLETNPWVVTGIVLGCIFAVAGIIFGVWKYKNRI
ncbi:MAG: prenyltransferase/squalene oxidase repeat-containing protein [Promethearchaeota archaeon]